MPTVSTHSPIMLGLIGALAACADAPVEPPAPPPTGVLGTPSDTEILARSRAALLEDAATVLGSASLAEVMAARTAILVRGVTSFPRMIRQPDGSFKREPPGVTAAIRTGSGWVRLGAAGARHWFDAAASGQLDRLVDNPAFWREAPITHARCTDPSGIIMLARDGGKEFLSPYPCGFTGLTGEAAQIVYAGRITDWSKVPAELRPAGLPLARFHEQTQARFRFMSGIHEERLMVIRTPAEWEGQWRRLMAPMRDPPPPPEVLFPREMLLMAAMGPQGSGGYRVVIDKVIDQGEELLAFVRFVSPGPRCGAIAVVTSPVDIVRVPYSEDVVRWVIEREVSDCP